MRTLSIFKGMHFYYLPMQDDTLDGRQLRCCEQKLLRAFGPIANKLNAIRKFKVGKSVSL